MDKSDQQAIDELFRRLADLERQSGPRDREAEALISDRIGRQPGAPYYMAQTIVVQQQALRAAQAQIDDFQRHIKAHTISSEGRLSSFSESGSQPTRTEGSLLPRVSAPNAVPPPQLGRGSFLASAAQTAVAVAGGVLLGNFISGMLAGNEANAAEAEPDTNAEPAVKEQADEGGVFDSFFGNDGNDL
jgi:hypothetical protein